MMGRQVGMQERLFYELPLMSVFRVITCYARSPAFSI